MKMKTFSDIGKCLLGTKRLLVESYFTRPWPVGSAPISGRSAIKSWARGPLKTAFTCRSVVAVLVRGPGCRFLPSCAVCVCKSLKLIRRAEENLARLKATSRDVHLPAQGKMDLGSFPHSSPGFSSSAFCSPKNKFSRAPRGRLPRIPSPMVK